MTKMDWNKAKQRTAARDGYVPVPIRPKRKVHPFKAWILKFAGNCAVCEIRLPAGTPVIRDIRDGSFACKSCCDPAE